ncbi:MAG: flagellin [Pseudomonadota bacterium]|nr:flagellin [Pseudomonadota bacterium]
MTQPITTNLASLNAQRNLNRIQGSLNTSLERLSSGKRINSAKDDAAGLAISNRFTTQIRGLNTAIRNTNDGISLAQTAESALGEITVGLQRIRDLAVQSSNGTNSPEDRSALQAEVDQLLNEIKRVSETTKFNGSILLNGTQTQLSFQIGANASESLSVKLPSMSLDTLGTNPSLVKTVGDRVKAFNASDNRSNGLDTQGIESNTFFFSPGPVVINDFGVKLASTATEDVVNIASDQYGGSITTAGSIHYQTESDNEYFGSGLAKSIAQRINNIRESGEESLQGVYAFAKTRFIGSDIKAQDFDIAATISNFNETNIGVGTIKNGDIKINGVDIGPASFTQNDADGTLTAAINAKSELTGVQAHVLDTGELVLETEDGRDIIFGFEETLSTGEQDEIFNALFSNSKDRVSGVLQRADDYLRITGQISIFGTDTISFTGDANDIAELGLDSVSLSQAIAADNGKATGSVSISDIRTFEAAQITIESVDSALAEIDLLRADLGAVTNRFESTIRNLSTVSESLSSANSRILDADYAAETAQLAKSQVLQQAGISILTQANALPQQTLELLG